MNFDFTVHLIDIDPMIADEAFDLGDWLVEHVDSALEQYFLLRRHLRKPDWDHSACIDATDDTIEVGVPTAEGWTL